MPAAPVFLPQLLANNGVQALRAAIAEPGRYAIEPKVDGVRGLIAFQPDGTIEARKPQRRAARLVPARSVPRWAPRAR